MRRASRSSRPGRRSTPLEEAKSGTSRSRSSSPERSSSSSSRSVRPGGSPRSARAAPALPAGGADGAGETLTLLDGFDFTESFEGKPLLRIKADRTVGYGTAAGLAPNLYAGEKVTLTVYPYDGAPVRCR